MKSRLILLLAASLLSLLTACKSETEQQSAKTSETTTLTHERADKAADKAGETSTKSVRQDASKAAKQTGKAEAKKAPPTTPQGKPLPGGAKRLDQAKAQDLLAKKPDLVVLDLRDPDDFKKERLAKAINVDQSEEKLFAQKVKTLDKSKTYLLYDYRTKRSEKALAELEKAGFKQVYLLEGGMREWTEAGLPVNK